MELIGSVSVCTFYVYVYKIFICVLLLLSRFSRVRLCATPWTPAFLAPPSVGFSRQEYWSGLPFPSPMHESEKWKGSRSVVSDPQRPHGLQPSRLLHPWDFPGKSTGVGCHHLSLIVFSAISLALEQKMFVVSLWDILAWGESKRGPDPLRKIQWTEPQNWNSTSFKCYLATWCPLSHTWSGVISSKIHLISLEHSR